MSANQKFTLRPAFSEEAALFYSLDEKDAELGTAGHLRINFGHESVEFWSTWWPHNDDELNMPEFKVELKKIVDELRKSGPLTGLSAMSSYCYDYGSGRLGDTPESDIGMLRRADVTVTACAGRCSMVNTVPIFTSKISGNLPILYRVAGNQSDLK